MTLTLLIRCLMLGKTGEQRQQAYRALFRGRMAERDVTAIREAINKAWAETINGLFKTELIRKRGPWRNVDEVEQATLEWVDWFNNRHLLKPIVIYRLLNTKQCIIRTEIRRWLPDSRQKPSGEPGAIQTLGWIEFLSARPEGLIIKYYGPGTLFNKEAQDGVFNKICWHSLAGNQLYRMGRE